MCGRAMGPRLFDGLRGKMSLINETLEKARQESDLGLFMGHPVADMSREDLLGLVAFLSNELDAAKQEHSRRLDVLSGLRR